jgi:hypothetical protein
MKKQYRNHLLLCMAVFSLFVVSPASALELGARAYAWFPSLTADARGNFGGAQGTTASLTDTLGVGNKPTYSVEAYGGVSKHHFSFMYTPFGYSDSKVLGSNLTFNGTTYTAGMGVQTELNFAMYDLKYQYDIVNMENLMAGFSFGPIAQVKYVTGDMKLTAPGPGFSQKQSFSVPVPMVGVGAHIGLIANLLEARAQVTGMGYSGNFLLEGMADISLTPFPFVDVHAGYKIIKLRLDTNDFYMDSQFSGPFVALTVGF